MNTVTRSLVAVLILGNILPSFALAFESNEDPDGYLHTTSTPFYTKDISARVEADAEEESIDPLVREIREATRDSLEKFMATLKMPTVNIPNYFDGEAESVTNGPIAVALLPVLSPKVGKTNFPLAQPDSIPKKDKKGRTVPASDPYAEMKDLLSIKISMVGNTSLHLKTKDGRELGYGKELSFAANHDKIDYILDGQRAPFVEGIALVTEPDQITRVRWQTIYGARSQDYRGNFILLPDITPVKQVCVKVINVLNIERYVSDVVLGEFIRAKNAEYYKAAAVYSRTKAYTSMRASRAAHLNHDIVAGSQAQLYLGIARETEETDLATQATLGQVVLYKGDLAEVWYGANSGGYVKDVRDAYPGYTGAPYLTSKPDVFVDVLRAEPNTGTHYRSIDPEKFLNAVRKTGVDFPDNLVIGIVPIETNNSKRTTGLRVFGMNTSVDVTGKAYEKLATDPQLRFGKPYLDRGRLKDGVIVAKTYGAGPGIGVCQVGAMLMATRMHATHEQITSFYMPGTYIGSVDSVLKPSAGASYKFY